ncbi:MAG: prepilin peptidase [Pseudonocardia sp.]|uniref:prepilin peptidase n=1 Tax=Pseudonocardia sp. TaxID=60912 RepID=UPI001AD339DF|nr:prepilin peptidase [Pseudonocardia sp.]MBN9102623.1 prepilin peptidase [Pseudonocardia sp.]
MRPRLRPVTSLPTGTRHPVLRPIRRGSAVLRVGTVLSAFGLVLVVVMALSVLPVVPPPVAGALLFAVAGCGAGTAARVVLGRTRRGARVRAPVCELALAVLWAAVGAGWIGGLVPGRWLPVLLGASWLAVAGSVVDVLHHRLPDALTAPAWPAALLVVLPLGPGALGRAAVGAVVAAAVHAAVHRAAPRALGGGDVKLAGPLGAVLAAAAWPALALAGLLAAVLSALVAAVLLVAGRTGRAGAVPHGPSMLVATWLVLAGAAFGAGAG